MDSEQKECAINFLPDGTISSVYHDDIFMGNEKIDVSRVTDVEFDNKTQQWIAKLRKTGEIIAIGKSREEVLKEEVKIVHDMLFHGIDIRPNETQN